MEKKNEEKLAEVLNHALVRSLTGEERAAIMFSGGVDSSVLAILAKKNCRQVILYTVAAEGSFDLDGARVAAEKIGCEHRVVKPSAEKIITTHQEVVSALRAAGMRATEMDGELGVVIRLCCEAARKDGFDFLISGTGAEELFGGYYSHVKHVQDGGDLAKLLEKEIAGLYEKDLKRNNYVASLSRIRLLLPFLDDEVVSVARGIPAAEKISEGIRKIVLRKAALLLGVPECAANRAKKAAQYGSGVHRAIEKAKQ